MSQLGFTSAETHTIGFGIWRDIERYKERESWPLYRASVHGFASQLGTVTGIGDVGSTHPLEVLPYVVTKNVSTTSGSAGFGRGAAPVGWWRSQSTGSPQRPARRQR